MGFFGRLFGKTPTVPKFPEQWRPVLTERVTFYVHLSPDERLHFEERMMEFLATTAITGVRTEVTDEDRMMLSASAIIPIFAFPNWKYHNLHEILVYPEHFDDGFTIGSKEQAILGMVGYGYMEGKMVISKKSLHHGFSNGTDKRNTAIHEFVHLMDKSDGNVDGLPVHFMDKDAALPWLEFMDHKILEIIEDDSDINDYGATNRAEFFAVASEYFFERPQLLEKKHPKLYAYLEQIFRQPLSDKKRIQPGKATRHFDPCPCGSNEKFRHCCMV